MVGFYRGLIFQVQDMLAFLYINSFSNLKRTMGANWATHPALNGLERLEKTGDKLQEMTFSMQLFSSAGATPRQKIDLLERYKEDGMSGRFVLGFHPVGRLPWVITNVGVAYNIILRGGGIYSATVDVTMKQYH